MDAGFLLKCQNLLRYLTPEMMHFQAWKKLLEFRNMQEKLEKLISYRSKF